LGNITLGAGEGEVAGEPERVSAAQTTVMWVHEAGRELREAGSEGDEAAAGR
jgi:hypothetical protein